MRKRLLAGLIGVGAGALLLGAYFSAAYAGIHLNPEMMVTIAGALAFASTVAVFALVSMDRPSFDGTKRTILLNEKEPAGQFIFRFYGKNISQITARPETPLSVMLSRYGDMSKRPPSEMTKDITVTLRGSKNPFPTITLQQLFSVLKPFRLAHVLLTSEQGEFIGYIPGKRALKEFTGDHAADKITKFIVDVIEHPENSAVIREIGGVPQLDTISETEDVRVAEAKFWKDEAVSGLIVHKNLKPVGYISKIDVLSLNAGRS